MLTSLIAMMALLLSVNDLHFDSEVPEFESVSAVDNPLYKPEDPSTMTLAVIGAGTLAVYFGSRRTIRTRRTVTLGETNRPHLESVSGAAVQTVVEAADERSRGAA